MSRSSFNYILLFMVAVATFFVSEFVVTVIDQEQFELRKRFFNTIVSAPTSETGFVKIEDKEEIAKLYTGYTSLKHYGTADERPLYKYTENFQRSVKPPKEASSRFLAFLGSSFIFGHKVSNENTIPQLVQNNLIGTRVYNYGLPGFPLSSILLEIASVRMRSNIIEPEGEFIITLTQQTLWRLLTNIADIHPQLDLPVFSVRKIPGFYKNPLYYNFWQTLGFAYIRSSALFGLMPAASPDRPQPKDKRLCLFFKTLKAEIQDEFGEVPIRIVDFHETTEQMKSCFERLRFNYSKISPAENCKDNALKEYDYHFGPKSSQSVAHKILNEFYNGDFNPSCE